MHESRGDVQIAFDLLDSMLPRDQQSIQRKELQVMQLAERIGDRTRAIQAAERLFGYRLDTASQAVLLASLRRLKLDELAEKVEARTKRRTPTFPLVHPTPNPTNSQLFQMMTLQKQGKTAEANRLALALLQRSSPMLIAPPTMIRSSSSSRTTVDNGRSQALEILRKSGELARATERIEAQLEKSTGSNQLYGQLLEYYQALGERKKTGTLLKKIVEEKPEANLFRYQLAKHLVSMGEQSEACDHYIALFRTEPNWLFTDFAAVNTSFSKAKRVEDLEKAIELIDARKLVQSTTSLSAISNFSRDSVSPEITASVFAKFFETFPSYRGMLISQMRDRFLLNQDRVFELFKHSIIPAETQAQVQPWYGLMDIHRYSPDGTVQGMFYELLHLHGSRERQDEFRIAIKNAAKQNPSWLGGKAMLGLISLEENKSSTIPRTDISPPLVSEDNPIDALVELLRSERVIESMPASTCWIIGQELEKSAKTQSIALQLYERAALQSNPSFAFQLQSSALMKLAKLYKSLDRKNDARELIIKHHRLNSSYLTGSSAQSTIDRFRFTNTLWAANSLLELGFPIDSIRYYRQLLAGPALPQNGTVPSVRVVGFSKLELEKSIANALALIANSSAEDSIAQLLEVREHRGTGTSCIDLMMELPKEEVGGFKKIQSGLLDMIDVISKAESIPKLLDDRLTSLQAQYPSDLSIGIVLAVTRMKTKSDQTDEALRHLVDWMEAHPLEKLPDGQNPNARQRREASLSVPLWMVARQCFVDGNHREIGQQLGERALSAARRQPGLPQPSSILFEWTDLLIKQTDHANAEAKLSELLSIAMERPHRKPSRSGEAPRVEDIPPLTMPQFNLAVGIESRASKNGMRELSMKVVRETLISGLPIELPRSTLSAPIAISGSTRVISSSGNNIILPNGVQAVGNSPSVAIRRVSPEETVVKWVTGILVKWKMQAYPQEDVYEFLESIVMPPSRPTEIRLFVVSSNLSDNPVPRSLAKSLLECAQTAGKLEELDQKIEVRKQNPSSQVAGTVLQILIAISEDEMEKAKLLLDDLAQQSTDGMSRSMLDIASLAAIPAISISSLRDPALVIFRKAQNLR